MKKIEGLVACICEGDAEHAILDILFENKLLIFDELLENKIIRERSAKKFEKKYLRKNFSSKISVVRILDSRNEKFNLSKLYENKVEVINVITAPEIEMLIIHSENKYVDYQKYKSKISPSQYCKNELRYQEVKNYDFVYGYFSDTDKLITAIKLYKSKVKLDKNEWTLFDILKT